MSLQLALRSFAELAASEPEAMTLALLGTFGAGARALERRNHTLNALEQIVEAGRERPAGRHASDFSAKVLLGGIREGSATGPRDGRAEQLVELADELGAWAGA